MTTTTTTYVLDLDKPAATKMARRASYLRMVPGQPTVLSMHGRGRATHGVAWSDVRSIKEEHAERLMHVMRVLLTLERGRPFDLGTYIDQSACGTVACACGWSMLDPWFQTNVPRHGHPSWANEAIFEALALAPTCGVDFVATYGDLSEWITGSVFLSEYLFKASSYPASCVNSAAVVAERIRLILNLAGYTGQHTLEF